MITQLESGLMIVEADPLPVAAQPKPEPKYRCVKCGKPSKETVLLFWRTCDGFHIQKPVCHHDFVVCEECSKSDPQNCPVCGESCFYT